MANERTRKELEPEIVARAMQDSDFKKKLLADPKAVVEAELGRRLPGYLKVNVVEETQAAITIVLPAGSTNDLSDADLESVAGGWICDTAWKAN